MALQDLLKDPLDLGQPDAQLFLERTELRLRRRDFGFTF